MPKRDLLFPVLACFFLVGCGKEQPEAASPAVTGSAAPTTGKPANAAPAVTLAFLDSTVTKAKEPFRIALIVKTRNNPFFQPMIAEFVNAAEHLGAIAEVQAPPQEMDKEKQFALVQGEIAKGVKAICIAPADSAAIIPVLLAAQRKGILVINLDNRIDAAAAKTQGLQLDGYVGADNEAGGKLAGEAMLAALGNKGVVGILEGIRGANNADARKKGFSDAVNGKLTIVDSEIANWDTEQAYRKTQAMLAAHPDIAGLFCANDKMAVGAMKAISESGKTGKITVVSYDNIADVKPALESGALYSTIEQHPDAMGRYAAKMAVGILNGDVPKGGDIMVPLETIRKK